MYTQHFNLTELPFSIAPNPRFLYLSPQHREALAHLYFGIGVGGGFVVLTGEVGTGKTTLCRVLLDKLPEDVDIALIFNPQLSSKELIANICDELHIPNPGPRSSLKQLIDALNMNLLDAHARGRRVIALIDEAQNLRFEVLEQIRLLTNLETNQRKLLQIILVGQPELNEILDRPGFRQLAQRITARYDLAPLKWGDTKEYIQHRMSVAGGSASAFSSAAMGLIHLKTRGIPRLINLMCDRALLGAFSRGKREVTAPVAWRAARELMSPPEQKLRRRIIGGVGLVLTLLLCAVMLGLTRPNGFSKLNHQTTPTPEMSAQALTGKPLPTDAKPLSTAAETSGDGKPTTPPAQAHSGADRATAGVDFSAWISNPRLLRANALSGLLTRWGQTVSAGADPCRELPAQGLRCQSFQGTWLQLTSLNLPAVMKFVLADGEARYATLASVKGSLAELSSGEITGQFETSELLSLWSGNAVVIWKPPVIDVLNVIPNETSPLAGSVRQRLGVPAAAGFENLYDEVLKQKVTEFQKSNGLKPDGIIGTMTLMRLQSGVSDPSIPRLLPVAH